MQSITRDGLTVALVAAHVDGHKFANDGQAYFEVLNGSGGSINVTVQTPNTVDGNAISDKVVAVAAGARKKFGPYPRQHYNQGSEEVYVDISAVTSVTLGAFRFS